MCNFRLRDFESHSTDIYLKAGIEGAALVFTVNGVSCCGLGRSSSLFIFCWEHWPRQVAHPRSPPGTLEFAPRQEHEGWTAGGVMEPALPPKRRLGEVSSPCPHEPQGECPLLHLRCVQERPVCVTSEPPLRKAQGTVFPRVFCSRECERGSPGPWICLLLRKLWPHQGSTQQPACDSGLSLCSASVSGGSLPVPASLHLRPSLRG